MKLTNLTTALFLVTTACGAVVDPSADPAPTPGVPTFEEPPIDGEEPPTAPLPLLIEAPRAATAPGSLFAMTFEAGSPIENLVSPLTTTRYDVVEQKIVTISDQEVQLVVELAPPTGSYSRKLVTDAIRNGGTYADRVLCQWGNIWQDDPRCESAAPPVAREIPSSGPITTAQWKLTVVDDVTGTSISGCVASGPNKLSCVLPGRAAASYRILASASGFADLWDGSASFGSFVIDGTAFVGAPPQTQWQCWDFPTVGNGVYCGARYEFIRFTALDRARLDFDPITVRITANGSTAAMATPALIWDAGNDDVPGATY